MSNQKKSKMSVYHNFKDTGAGEQKLEIVEKGGNKLEAIFQFYCSFGDNLNTQKMKFPQFFKMLKDGHLIRNEGRDFKTSATIQTETEFQFNFLDTNSNEIHFDNKFGIHSHEVDSIFHKITGSSLFQADPFQESARGKSNEAIRKKVVQFMGLQGGGHRFSKDNNQNGIYTKKRNNTVSSRTQSLVNKKRSISIIEGFPIHKSSIKTPSLLNASPNNHAVKATYLDYDNFLKSIEIIAEMVLPDLKKEDAIQSVLNNNLLPLYPKTLKKKTMFYELLCKEKTDAEFVSSYLFKFINFIG